MTHLKLTHISNQDNTYKVNINSIMYSTVLKNIVISNDCNNKHCVNFGSEEALIFIVKYLNYYDNDVEEISPPDYPLNDGMKLKDIFELEEHIFNDLIYEINTNEKKLFLNHLIKIAEELKINNLIKKLAAILAYNMLNMDYD